MIKCKVALKLDFQNFDENFERVRHVCISHNSTLVSLILKCTKYLTDLLCITVQINSWKHYYESIPQICIIAVHQQDFQVKMLSSTCLWKYKLFMCNIASTKKRSHDHFVCTELTPNSTEHYRGKVWSYMYTDHHAVFSCAIRWKANQGYYRRPWHRQETVKIMAASEKHQYLNTLLHLARALAAQQPAKWEKVIA